MTTIEWSPAGMIGPAYQTLLLLHALVAATAFGVAVRGRLQRAARQQRSHTAENPVRVIESIGMRALQTGSLTEAPPVELREQSVALLDSLLSTRPGRVRGRIERQIIGAACVLAHHPQEEDAHRLCTLLFWSPTAAIETTTAWALGKAAPVIPSASLALSTMLRDREGLGTATASWALQRALTMNPDHVGMVASDPSPRLRRMAVSASGKRLAIARQKTSADIESARHACLTGLEDKSDAVRIEACRALRGDRSAVAWVEARLHDESHTVRCAAAATLGTLNTSQTILQIAAMLPHLPSSALRKTLNDLAASDLNAPAELLAMVTRGGRQASIALACIATVNADRRIVEKLLEIVRADDHDSDLRRGAARAIAFLARQRESFVADRRSIATLLAVLETETDEELLAPVVEAIAVAGENPDVAPLVMRIGTAGRSLREKIVESLALHEFLATHPRKRSSSTVISIRSSATRTQ